MMQRSMLRWTLRAADSKEFRLGQYAITPLAIDYSTRLACIMRLDAGGEWLACTGEAAVLTLYSDQWPHTEQTFDLGTGDAMADVKWRGDDLAVACADGHAYVYNAHRLASADSIKHCFDCGGEAVKTVRWVDAHCLAACGRDGVLRIWDCRLSSRNSSLNCPSYSVVGAHGTGRVLSTITAMACLHDQHHIVTVGQPDYDLKVWDRRYTGTTVRPSAVVKNPTGLDDGKRARAFIDLACSGDSVFASSTGNSIYKVHPGNWRIEGELGHPDFRLSSFFLKLAVSPDDRWIACGSSDEGGAVWLFAVNGLSVYRLSPQCDQGAECTGVSWHPHKAALCAIEDNGGIQFWKNDWSDASVDGNVFRAELMDWKDPFVYLQKTALRKNDLAFPSARSHHWPPLHRNKDSMCSALASKKKRTILDYFPSSSGHVSPAKRSCVNQG